MPDPQSAQMMPTDSELATRLLTKRRAVELLLEWGFSPTTIAQVLGCSTEWITTMDERRAS